MTGKRSTRTSPVHATPLRIVGGDPPPNVYTAAEREAAKQREREARRHERKASRRRERDLEFSMFAARRRAREARRAEREKAAREDIITRATYAFWAGVFLWALEVVSVITISNDVSFLVGADLWGDVLAPLPVMWPAVITIPISVPVYRDTQVAVMATATLRWLVLAYAARLAARGRVLHYATGCCTGCCTRDHNQKKYRETGCPEDMHSQTNKWDRFALRWGMFAFVFAAWLVVMHVPWASAYSDPVWTVACTYENGTTLVMKNAGGESIFRRLPTAAQAACHAVAAPAWWGEVLAPYGGWLYILITDNNRKAFLESHGVRYNYRFFVEACVWCLVWLYGIFRLVRRACRPTPDVVSDEDSGSEKKAAADKDVESAFESSSVSSSG